MRVIVASLLAVGAFAMSGTPAAAQTYQWCGEYLGDDGGGTNCGFSTLAQCQAAISGNGGRCYQNPFYTAQTREPARGKRRQERD